MQEFQRYLLLIYRLSFILVFLSVLMVAMFGFRLR